jgi:hypothetical protein
MPATSVMSRDSMFAYSSVPSSTATHSPMVEDTTPMWSEVINTPPPSPLPSCLSRRSVVVKAEELTSSPDFRNLRSTVLPRNSSNLTQAQVAIPAPYKTSFTNQGQDVPPINTAATYPPSTATRTNVYPHSIFETTVSGASSSNHVLNSHVRPRPRTSSQVFTSSHDLVAHYGLPQSLPPAPSTLPRRTQLQPDPAPSIHSALFSFESLASDYLNMLRQKPTDTMTADSQQSVPQTVSPADLHAPSCQIEQQRPQDPVDILNQGNYSTSLRCDVKSHCHLDTLDMSPVSPELNTPELTTSPDFDWHGGDFLSSPAYDTPFDEFLSTPLIADDGDMYTDSVEAGPYGALFPSMSSSYGMDYEKPVVPAAPPAYDEMYRMSPSSPVLHDFDSPATINPASIYPSKRLPSDLSAFPSSTSCAPSSSSSTPAPPSNRRKSSATGTRKGVTPEALVPIDAPTQARRYVTPSATSRKEVPSIFVRKRTRTQAFAEDEDELLEELRPDATEREQIEYKRRQNTVAARRSRKRKLEFQQKLVDDVDRLQKGRDMWRERARLLQGMMLTRGLPCPTFPPDEDEI